LEFARIKKLAIFLLQQTMDR